MAKAKTRDRKRRCPKGAWYVLCMVGPSRAYPNVCVTCSPVDLYGTTWGVPARAASHRPLGRALGTRGGPRKPGWRVEKGATCISRRSQFSLQPDVDLVGPMHGIKDPAGRKRRFLGLRPCLRLLCYEGTDAPEPRHHRRRGAMGLGLVRR